VPVDQQATSHVVYTFMLAGEAWTWNVTKPVELAVLLTITLVAT
jgi:hypothetical protein